MLGIMVRRSFLSFALLLLLSFAPGGAKAMAGWLGVTSCELSLHFSNETLTAVAMGSESGDVTAEELPSGVVEQDSLLREFLGGEGFDGASIGISVKRISDGEEVVSYNATTSLIPASAVKILTTTFALDVCGVDDRFLTEIYCEGPIKDGALDGKITISCEGDPTLDSKHFGARFMHDLLELLAKNGIESVEGIEFEYKIPFSGAINGAWLSEDIANYYGASWMPFNWSDNTCRIHMSSTANSSKFLYETPTAGSVTYKNLAVVDKYEGNDLWIYGGPSGYREIRGTMLPNQSDYIIRGAMGFPEEYFVAEFEKRIKLKNSGATDTAGSDSATATTTDNTTTATEDGVARTDNATDTAMATMDSATGTPSTTNATEAGSERRLIGRFLSPTIKEIVAVTNRESVNLFAEALAGRAMSKQGLSRDKYGERMVEWLTPISPLAERVILKDACGLAPRSVVPAGLFTDLLLWADNRWDGAFNSSLSTIGVDGTLKSFGSSYHDMKGAISAKTGSMNGVRSIAGYLTSKSGERYVFAIIVNNYTCKGTAVNRASAKLLHELFETL